MTSIYKIIVLSFVLLLTSCTDVVEVDTPDGGNRLVVEASILVDKNQDTQPQSIKLSYSTPYFAKDRHKPAEGAEVKLVHVKTSNSVDFVEGEAGIYTLADFAPVSGEEYQLQISIGDRQYTATERLVPLASVKSMTYEGEVTDSTSDQIVKMKFDDPGDKENFYMITFVDDQNNKPETNTSSDEYFNGQEAVFRYGFDSLAVGTKVEATLQGLSSSYFSFLGLLNEQSAGGGPFATTPVKLIGNCKSVTDPKEEVLGYFRLSEVERRSVNVK